MTRDYSMFLVVFYVFYYAFYWVTCSVSFHFHAFSYFLAFEFLSLCFYYFRSLYGILVIVLSILAWVWNLVKFICKTMLLMVLWALFQDFRLPRTGFQSWKGGKDQMQGGCEVEGLKRDWKKEARTGSWKGEKFKLELPLKRFARTALAVECFWAAYWVVAYR